MELSILEFSRLVKAKCVRETSAQHVEAESFWNLIDQCISSRTISRPLEVITKFTHRYDNALTRSIYYCMVAVLIENKEDDEALSILNSGCSLYLDGDATTLLHEAVKIGSLDLVQALFQKGADFLSEDENGKIPENYAVEESSIDRLLQQRSDIYEKLCKQLIDIDIDSTNADYIVRNIMMIPAGEKVEKERVLYTDFNISGTARGARLYKVGCKQPLASLEVSKKPQVFLTATAFGS